MKYRKSTTNTNASLFCETYIKNINDITCLIFRQHIQYEKTFQTGVEIQESCTVSLELVF